MFDMQSLEHPFKGLCFSYHNIKGAYNQLYNWNNASFILSNRTKCHATQPFEKCNINNNLMVSSLNSLKNTTLTQLLVKTFFNSFDECLYPAPSVQIFCSFFSHVRHKSQCKWDYIQVFGNSFPGHLLIADYHLRILIIQMQTLSCQKYKDVDYLAF